MFYKEYKVASCIQELLKEKLKLEIDEHEIGYIALHVHAAIVDENVSQAMEIARTVRECISLVEKETGNSFQMHGKISDFNVRNRKLQALFHLTADSLCCHKCFRELYGHIFIQI